MRSSAKSYFSQIIWTTTLIGLLIIGNILITAQESDNTSTHPQGRTVATPTPIPHINTAPSGTPLPGNLDQVTFIDDGQTHIVRRLIPQDWIMPLYNPRFTDNPTAYDDEELVMGVEINGDARAYSVGHLVRREMVNDEVGGIPILVTW